MTEDTTEPKFVNLSPQIVHVQTPEGRNRCVRPYRELTAFSWRTEEDCVCIGKHYAQFPGLLSPFPGAEEAARAAVAPVSGIAAKATTGRFTGTGDVIRPDGTIKKDPPVGTREGDGPVPPAGSEGSGEPTEPVGEDEPADQPLESVPGLSAKVIESLKAGGFTTARSLADCQDEESVAKLMAVKHVGRNAERFITAAQNLLGYVDEDAETADEATS